MRKYPLRILMVLIPLALLQTPVLAQKDSYNTQSQTTAPTPDLSKQVALSPLEGTKQIQLNLVNCGGWLGLDCSLAHILLPKSAYIDDRELHFDNATPTPTKVLGTRVIVQGDLTGYQLNNSAISVSETSQSLPANQISNLHLLIKRSAIPPDQYNGSVYLFLDGQGKRLTLPINLNVRSGPLVPLLVLLLGVVIGRLFKYLQQGGKAQSDALIEVQRLRQDIIDSKLNSEDKEILNDLSTEVLKLVYRQKLEEVGQKIATIRESQQLLASLEEIEKENTNSSTAENTQGTQDTEEKIRSVRHHIKNQENDKAENSIKELEDQQLKKTVIAENFSFGIGDTESAVDDKTQTNITEDKTKSTSSSDKLLVHVSEFLQKELPEFLRKVSGVSDVVRAETTLWVVRPLLSLALLIGLSVVGLKSLYVENGKSFGARSFPDYIGLIIWGLSADVASRSLSDLQGSNK